MYLTWWPKCFGRYAYKRQWFPFIPVTPVMWTRSKFMHSHLSYFKIWNENYQIIQHMIHNMGFKPRVVPSIKSKVRSHLFQPPIIRKESLDKHLLIKLPLANTCCCGWQWVMIYLTALGPVSLRLMTPQFKDIVTDTKKYRTVKCIFCGVWVQNSVWNFKGALWNFTQNFEPIHRKIYILPGVKNWRLMIS